MLKRLLLKQIETLVMKRKKKESKKPLEILQPVVFLLQILPRTRFELILFNLI